MRRLRGACPGSGELAASSLALGCWEANRHACGARSVGAVLGGRGGRGAVRAPFVPFGRSSRSACVTERSVRAFGAVGATRAGRSRVRCVWTPRDSGGDRGRSGEIGRDWNLPKILPRFAEIEIRSDLKSSKFQAYPIFLSERIRYARIS